MAEDRTCDRCPNTAKHGSTLCGICEVDWTEEQWEQEAEEKRRQWYEELEARLSSIESRLGALERRVNDVSAEVERVGKEIPADLESRLTALETLTPVSETRL